MIDRTIMAKMWDIALDIDHNAAFGGKSKGNQHLSRVVKIALFLCDRLKADRDVVEVAAYLHDAALPTKDDYNYSTNKTLVTGVLEKSGLELDPLFIDRVAEAAASHEGTTKPSTLEAGIVHDADVIEKTGILGIIRHTWKLTNHGQMDPSNVTDQDIHTVVDHIKWRQSVLQTEPAKMIARGNDCDISLEVLRKIVPMISKLASQSVVTEVIAEHIKPFLDEKQVVSLESQLSLAYLTRY